MRGGPHGSDVVIRPVEPRDAPAAIRIVADVFREYGMTFAPEGWDRDVTEPHVRYAGPGAVFLAAERAGEVIGIAGCHVEGGHAELHRLYIDPAARGLRLGARLCAELEDWAFSAGARRMVLWSDVRFTHAHSMYRARGYRIFGSRTLEDPDESVEFGMERSLAPPGAHAMPAMDPLSNAMRESIRPVPVMSVLEDPPLLHKARFTISGMLDLRQRDLPSIGRIFPGGTLERCRTLVGDPHTVLGFRDAAGETLWHPSCRIKL